MLSVQTPLALFDWVALVIDISNCETKAWSGINDLEGFRGIEPFGNMVQKTLVVHRSRDCRGHSIALPTKPARVVATS